MAPPKFWILESPRHFTRSVVQTHPCLALGKLQIEYSIFELCTSKTLLF